MLHIMNQEKRNEGRVKQRGGNIMDKGSKEAERKGEEGRERKETRKKGGRACCREGSKGMCLTASFCQAPSVLVRQ